MVIFGATNDNIWIGEVTFKILEDIHQHFECFLRHVYKVGSDFVNFVGIKLVFHL